MLRLILFSGSGFNHFAGSFYDFAYNLVGAVDNFSYGFCYFFFNYYGSFFSSSFFSLLCVAGAGEHRHAESNGEHKEYFFHFRLYI